LGVVSCLGFSSGLGLGLGRFRFGVEFGFGFGFGFRFGFGFGFRFGFGFGVGLLGVIKNQGLFHKEFGHTHTTTSRALRTEQPPPPTFSPAS
jgi:hypothetical protein